MVVSLLAARLGDSCAADSTDTFSCVVWMDLSEAFLFVKALPVTDVVVFSFGELLEADDLVSEVRFIFDSSPGGRFSLISRRAGPTSLSGGNFCFCFSFAAKLKARKKIHMKFSNRENELFECFLSCMNSEFRKGIRYFSTDFRSHAHGVHFGIMVTRSTELIASRQHIPRQKRSDISDPNYPWSGVFPILGVKMKKMKPTLKCISGRFNYQ
jgi:hypothetical protein